MSATILVTGANGFVGRELCATLAQRGWHVRAATRFHSPVAGAAEHVVIGGIGAATDWSAALARVDAVAHLAARVHVLHDDAENAGLYDEVNARGTHRLAQAAAAAGVRDFLFLSSIKVSGEERDAPYLPTDVPAPRDAYGRSKLEAERGLREIAVTSGMRVAVIRPPLVYGAGVRGNFLRLMRWVARGIPLPFGAIDNRRSLVSTWNLCDLACRLLAAPVENEYPWLVSDGAPLSTAGLVRGVARAMGRPARLVPVPVAWLKAGAHLLGRSEEIGRLCDSLAVDCAATRTHLAWTPPVDADTGFERTANAFLAAEYRHAR